MSRMMGRSLALAGLLSVSGWFGLGATPAKAQGYGFSYSSPGFSMGVARGPVGHGHDYGRGYGHDYGRGYGPGYGYGHPGHGHNRPLPPPYRPYPHHYPRPHLYPPYYPPVGCQGYGAPVPVVPFLPRSYYPW